MSKFCEAKVRPLCQRKKLCLYVILSKLKNKTYEKNHPSRNVIHCHNGKLPS